MEFRIDEKTYRGKFGIKFVRELDKKFGMKRDDIDLGMAISTKTPSLLAGDTTTLADFIHLSTVTENTRPTLEEIENFIDDHDDIEELFDEVVKELEEANATKKAFKEVQKRMGANQEEGQEDLQETNTNE